MIVPMLAIQLIGLMGFLLAVSSFQPKFRRHILKFQLTANVAWVLHYALLGATTGAGLNVVGGLRAFVFNRYGSQKDRPRWLLGAILAAIVAMVALTWQGWLSLLPMTGMLIATIGYWQRDAQRIRQIALFASPFWLIYGIASGSYAGVLTEFFVMTSIVIGLWRHRA